MKRAALAVLLTVVLVFASFPVAFADTETAESSAAVVNSSTFTDIGSHWAAAAIEKWSGYGIINGYEGLFRPDDSITRGEMAVILDNMMDYQKAAANTFTDLPDGQFYTEAVLKANEAGIIKGDGTSVRPNDKITKEEAAVMLSRAFAVANADSPKALKDASAVSSWAKKAVFGMEAKGYVGGYGGYFNPKAKITRAEAVTMINNIVKAYYTAAGTYTDNVKGTAVIKVSGVTLKNMTVSENLIIAEGVGQGDVYLDSITVNGEAVVRGGGENSVHITGTSIMSKVTIQEVGGKVRIVVEDGANVSEVFVELGEDIIITGNVGSIDLEASNATVYATDAKIGTATIEGEGSKLVVGAASTINTVNVASTAKNTSIETAKGAVVSTVVSSAQVNISGTGSVTKVTLNEGADGSKVTTPNTVTTVASGVNGVTGPSGISFPANTIDTNSGDGKSAKVEAGSQAGLPSNNNNGNGNPPPPPPPSPSLTLISVKIDNKSVGTTADGAYLLSKDWTSGTAMTATVTGKDFDSTKTYHMKVTAIANGGLTYTFKQDVTGSDMNVTNKDISQTNILGKLNKDSFSNLTKMLYAWTQFASAGDRIEVTIAIDGGATLCAWTYEVYAPK